MPTCNQRGTIEWSMSLWSALRVLLTIVHYAATSIRRTRSPPKARVSIPHSYIGLKATHRRHDCPTEYSADEHEQRVNLIALLPSFQDIRCHRNYGQRIMYRSPDAQLVKIDFRLSWRCTSGSKARNSFHEKMKVLKKPLVHENRGVGASHWHSATLVAVLSLLPASHDAKIDPPDGVGWEGQGGGISQLY